LHLGIEVSCILADVSRLPVARWRAALRKGGNAATELVPVRHEWPHRGGKQVGSEAAADIRGQVAAKHGAPDKKACAAPRNRAGAESTGQRFDLV
jgi:hypothetical protein